MVRPQWIDSMDNGANGHPSEIDGHGEDVGIEVRWDILTSRNPAIIGDVPGRLSTDSIEQDLGSARAVAEDSGVGGVSKNIVEKSVCSRQ